MRILYYLKKYCPFKNYFINNHQINKITDNSKDVQKNDVYFYLCKDKHYEYINEAISKGAKTIFVSKDCDFKTNLNVNIIKVDNPKIDIGRINKEIYLKKYEKFPIMISITGTCGKTTSSILTFSFLKSLNKDVLLISSNGIYSYYAKTLKMFSTNNTTPSNNLIYKYLSLHELSYDYVIIEVSSQALSDLRVIGIDFDYTLITNFYQEHLEYYESEKDYLEAKQKILSQTRKHLIINEEINYFDSFIEKTNVFYTTFGFDKGDIKAKILNANLSVSEFLISYQNKKYLVKSKLIGDFNVYNFLGVFSLLKVMGFFDELIINSLSNIDHIDGRMNILNYKKREIIIDYAHSHLAFEKVMEYLNRHSNSNLIVVVGAGGMRNTFNRSFIGQVTTSNSSKVIFTEDNSRTEDVKKIISEITNTLDHEKYLIEYERKKAIDLALSISNEGDIIAILGKGNEDFIISKKIKRFNDLEYIKSLIKNNE